MSNEVEVYERLMQIGEAQRFSTFFGASTEHAQKIAEHTATAPFCLNFELLIAAY